VYSLVVTVFQMDHVSGLVATFPASQGFLNAIAFFVTNKRVRVRWLRAFGFRTYKYV
jgi:hypothetical protein